MAKSTDLLTNIKWGEIGERFSRVVQRMLDSGMYTPEHFEQLVINGAHLEDALMDLLHKRMTRYITSSEVGDKVYFSRVFDKPIEEQIQQLHTFFPALQTTSKARAIQKLPLRADWFFAFPRWQAIAPTYYQAVVDVFTLMSKQRTVFLHEFETGNNMEEKRFRQSARTQKALGNIALQQQSDIMVIPCQVKRKSDTTHEFMCQREFGLGLFEIGCLVLLFPNLLSRDLEFVLCLGDEYHWNGNFEAPERHVTAVYSSTPIRRYHDPPNNEIYIHFSFGSGESRRMAITGFIHQSTE